MTAAPSPATAPQFSPVSLAGNAVVVTGAGRGIGESCARYLATLGARVMVSDLDGAAAVRVAGSIVKAGGLADAFAADVSSWDECEALMAACAARFGRIDGLVNNAGIIAFGGPADDPDGKQARKVFEVNLIGSYYAGVHAMKHMFAQGGGAIVNITSGAQAGLASVASYGASKGGVASLTYCWAIDGAAHGVRVNAVSPIATTAISRQTDAFVAAQGRKVAERLFVDPAVNAPAIAFLLSKSAVDVTGQVLRVQGRSLQLMTHPAVLAPSVERERWTAQDVADVFANDYASRLPPLGVAVMKPNYETLFVAHRST